jgi:hypothetical protein
MHYFLTQHEHIVGKGRGVNDMAPPFIASDDLPVDLAACDTQTDATRLYARGGRYGITIHINGCLGEAARPFFASIAELAQQAEVPCIVDLEKACVIFPEGIKALKLLRKATAGTPGGLRIIHARPNIRGILLHHGFAPEDASDG